MIYFISECLDTSLTNIQWLGGIQLKKDPAKPTYNSVPIQWKRMSIDDIIRVYEYVYTFESTVYCQKNYLHKFHIRVEMWAYGLFCNECKFRAHQTRRTGLNSRPISAEIVLPRLQSEIKVALFFFASRSFL
jgi:hypothetical protein